MKIVIAEDHTFLLEDLVEDLKDRFNNKASVYGFNNAHTAFSFIQAEKDIDVLITDLNMPEMTGLDLIERVRKDNPAMKIVVLTMFYSNAILKRLITLNVNGYLLKHFSHDEVNKAIDQVISGKDFFSPLITVKSKDHNFLTDDENNQILHRYFRTQRLTNREIEVCKYMLNNSTNNEISESMGLSADTIKGYRKNIYNKLRVNNVLDLYKLAMSFLEETL